MSETHALVPDPAVRVALWRALHVQVDPAPYVLDDQLGLQLAAPGASWRKRADMDVAQTARIRASIVARARYIEDLVVAGAERDVRQYVILGAGLDTFAQRRRDVAARLQLFEVDRRDTQAWKRDRLRALGFDEPDFLRFVAADFERSDDWLAPLTAAGFDVAQPALVASAGVSMYLTHDANVLNLRQIAQLARGTTLVLSFILPLELADAEDRPGLAAAIRGAQESGTPFLSQYAPEQAVALALSAGFSRAEHISSTSLAQRYFSKRADGLRPGTGEQLLLATL
jgi:methyltransferase (TIGR00027 family)